MRTFHYFSIKEQKWDSEILGLIAVIYRYAGKKIGKFTKQDIRELCPALSVSSIEGALRKLVKAGELKREGSGKRTYYVRLK